MLREPLQKLRIFFRKKYEKHRRSSRLRIAEVDTDSNINLSIKLAPIERNTIIRECLNLTSSAGEIADEQGIRHFIQAIFRHQCPTCRGYVMENNTKIIFELACEILQLGQGPKLCGQLRRLPATSKVGITCPNTKCKTVSCPCCSKKTPDPASTITLASSSTGRIGTEKWCCDGIRLFHIFVLLCGPHAHPHNELASMYQDVQVNCQPSSQAKSASSSKKDSSSSDTAKKVERSNNFMPVSLARKRVPPSSPNKPDNCLETLPLVLMELTRIWPQIGKQSLFDHEPPQLLLAILRRSPLMCQLAELLREGCVKPIMSRPVLYNALFDFLEIVAKHPLSASAVRESRPEYPFDQTILPLAFGETVNKALRVSPATSGTKDKGKGKAVVLPSRVYIGVSHVQSLASFLPPLADQAKATMKSCILIGIGAKDTLDMCQRICLFADEYGHSTESMTRRKQRKAGLCQWLSSEKVAEIECDNWVSGYSFRHFLGASASNASCPERMKRLLYEIKILRRGLPEGIFVRYDGTRLDTMKAMIVGPAGTPYEYGLFEFDIFCDFSYPRKPPKVAFKTSPPYTKINPNLYVGGKVCLSLLGTWSGDQWLPDKSTLLQVLVSLQGMVLCENPWYNEPGHHPGASNDNVSFGVSSEVLADVYSKKVRGLTVSYGITEWLRMLRDGRLEDTPWADLVRTHFEVRRREVLRVIGRWEAEARGTDSEATRRFREGIVALNTTF